MTYTTYDELNEVQQIERDLFPKIRLYDYTEEEAHIAIKEKLGADNFAECVYINNDQILIAKRDQDRYIEMCNRQYEEKSNFILFNLVHVIRSEMMDYDYMNLKDPKPILDSLKIYVDVESEGFKDAWVIAEKLENDQEIYYDADGLIDHILTADIETQLGVAEELDEYKKILDTADFSRLTDNFIHSASSSIRAEMARRGYVEGLERDYSEVVQKAVREYFQKQEKQSDLTREQEKKQRQRLDNSIENFKTY